MGTVKCGEIFISDSIKLTYSCSICYQVFDDLESYENHIIYDDNHIEELFKNNEKKIKLNYTEKIVSLEFESVETNSETNFDNIEEHINSDEEDAYNEEDSVSEAIYPGSIFQLEQKCSEFAREGNENNNFQNNRSDNNLKSNLIKLKESEIEAGNFQCYICFSNFNFSDEYEAHLKRNRCGICPICNLSFSRIYPHLERRHREIHPKYAKEGQLIFNRKLGKLVTKNESEASKFIQQKTSSLNECEDSTSYAIIPDLNIENDSKIDSLKCGYCYQTFEISSEFEEHEKRGTCGKCSICEIIFFDIWRHLFSSHKGLFDSTENSKMKYDRLLGEFIEDDSEECFECNQCGKYFKNEEILKQHSIEHVQSSYKFKCSICGKTCDRKFRYLKHMKTHLEKSFKCNMCKHAFRDEQDLCKHKASVHAGERNIKCSYDECQSYFVNNRGRIRHEKSMHRNGVLKYYCATCKLAFRSSGLLNKHNNQAHLLQNTIIPNSNSQQNSLTCERILYPCGNCTRSFFSQRHLKCHLRYCHNRKSTINMPGMKSFECKLCSRKYVNKKSLLYHMRMKHSSDVKISEE